MTSSITAWLIITLWCQSDRAYDPDKYSAPIIFQNKEAKLLVYVPPGRQRIVAIDLKTMTIIGSYHILNDIDYPATRNGEPAKITRLDIPHPDTLKRTPIEPGRQYNVKTSVIVGFNTREVGVFDLRSGFYHFLHNKGP